MSTNINISVGDNKLLEQARLQQAASRQAQLEKEANQRLATEATDARTKALVAQGLDANGNPLTATGFQTPQVERRPAANRQGDVIGLLPSADYNGTESGLDIDGRPYTYKSLLGYRLKGANFNWLLRGASSWDKPYDPFSLYSEAYGINISSFLQYNNNQGPSSNPCLRWVKFADIPAGGLDYNASITATAIANPLSYYLVDSQIEQAVNALTTQNGLTFSFDKQTSNSFALQFYAKAPDLQKKRLATLTVSLRYTKEFLTANPELYSTGSLVTLQISAFRDFDRYVARNNFPLPDTYELYIPAKDTLTARWASNAVSSIPSFNELLVVSEPLEASWKLYTIKTLTTENGTELTLTVNGITLSQLSFPGGLPGFMSKAPFTVEILWESVDVSKTSFEVETPLGTESASYLPEILDQPVSPIDYDGFSIQGLKYKTS